MAYSRPSLSAWAELSTLSQQFLKALLAQSTSALPFILLAHHCRSQGRQSLFNSICKIAVPPIQQKERQTNKQKKRQQQQKLLFRCSVVAYIFVYAEP